MIYVGKMIAKVRIERGYSQKQLADKLNLSKQAISNYETGKREPDYVTLEAIADALNVPVTMLISPEEQERALNEIYATYSTDKKIKEIGQQLTKPKRSKQWRVISEGMSTFEAENNPAFQALYQYLTTAYPSYFAERNDDDANDPES